VLRFIGFRTVSGDGLSNENNFLPNVDCIGRVCLLVEIGFYLAVGVSTSCIEIILRGTCINSYFGWVTARFLRLLFFRSFFLSTLILRAKSVDFPGKTIYPC
jgi:hypothetical protein